jgi:RNA polymerase sigma factor (sigma-70 family)
MTDLQLLAHYRRDRSRQALEELIRRHAPWVHAVAIRRVGEAHLAEDVMQAVFIVLMEKPPTITSESGVPGWLFGVTCNASSQLLRSEARRKRREGLFAMHHRESAPPDVMSPQQWDALAPHLDLALESLGEADRSAVLLRFYQQKSHADVAAALGVSEDAARKRVSRAVIKLREALHRRGMAVPAITGFALGLEAHAVPGVSAVVMESALAVASGAAASQAAGLAKGAAFMLTWTKAKLAVAACAAVLLLGVAAGIATHFAAAQVAPPQLAQPAVVSRPVAVEPAPRPAPDASWRERFFSVYRLEDGEVLRRIAPPFIPERMDWYRTHDATQFQLIPRGPEYMTFRWDGSLQPWGMGFGYRDGQTVRQLLGSTLRMKSYEFDGPAELLGHKLTGDFIVRDGASTQEQLDALCHVVRADGGPAVRFALQTIPRPLIVVSGRFEFRPLKGVENERSVHLYVGEPDRTSGGGGGSGDLDDFIREVGSRVAIPVVIEATSDTPTTVSYRYHRSSNLSEEPRGPGRDEKVRRLLEAVAQQTGLQFKLETREVSLWMAMPGDAADGL